MPDISEASERDHPLALVYIARRVPEGETVQAILERERITSFTGLVGYRLNEPLSLLFQSGDYSGIGFYARTADAERARILLRDHGFARGTVDRPAVEAVATVLWRRLDQPGHESARLWSEASGWHLGGTAVFRAEGQPCRLDYLVVCDSAWRTVSARVSGWVGVEPIEVDVQAGSARRWSLDAEESSTVAGAFDIDLAFSPSTNLLPIRRLGLEIGQEARVRAAWLRFPDFTLEPLEQVYHRLDASTYRYVSAGGAFVRELIVDASGFVTRYPGLWELEIGPVGGAGSAAPVTA